MQKNKILNRVLKDVLNSQKSKTMSTKHSVYVSGIFEDSTKKRKKK